MSRARTWQSNTAGRNRIDRLPELAAELVRRQVAVIIGTGGPPSAFAASGCSRHWAAIQVLSAKTSHEIDAAFDTIAHEPDALFVGSFAFFNIRRVQDLRVP